jgi:hypothetical protein
MARTIDAYRIIAITTGEPEGRIVETHRFTRNTIANAFVQDETPDISDLSEADMLAGVPLDQGAAHAAALVREFRARRGKSAVNVEAPGYAHTLVALLTHAAGRKEAAKRAWALMFAPLASGTACPVTGATFCGEAVKRLLSENAIFRQGRELWVAGEIGAVEVRWKNGSATRFQVGAGIADFEPDKPLVRSGSIEVAKLQRIFDAIKGKG